jgi:Gpi18-like mannosyltransferase
LKKVYSSPKSEKSSTTMPIRKFFKTDFGIALVATVVWKITMLLIGYLIDSSMHGATSIISHTAGWDSGWYMTVIRDHYLTNAASAAFYPLFPLLVSIVHFLSFNSIDILTAGQIVNSISVWFVIAALLTLGRNFFGDKNRFWLVALVLCAPAAFFMHVFYSEAIFMAIGFWAYIFALRRNWLYMGILLAILTSARLPSILIIGLCGLEYMRAYDWNMKKIFNKEILYFMLAPIGSVAYGLYLLKTRGDFWAMFHAYQATTDWVYQVFDVNIVKTILKVIYQILRACLGLRPFDNDLLINHILPIISLFILGVSSLYLLIKQKGKSIPLGIFGLAAIVMFTLNSNVVSAHRYILPCLTIYIALIYSTKGKYQQTILACLCLAGIITQLFLFSLFISNIFAG